VRPRGTAALLWAATGVLVFLVGHQAYLLIGGRFLGVGPVAAVALAVFATTGAAAYSLDGHLGPGGRDRGPPLGTDGDEAEQPTEDTSDRSGDE
jgi:hypothetical protein